MTRGVDRWMLATPGPEGRPWSRLLERRRPLGEAVVPARRDPLRDFRNPLGLLCSMHGAADLTVEQARPGIYRAVA